jgi:FMN phosphatase YigB (HAD superfamily)
LGLFAEHPDLGILYPVPPEPFPYWMLTNQSNLGGMRDLHGQIGVPFDESRVYVDFPVGTMFWARGKALEPLLRQPLQGFPDESGQVDGTLAHAVERSLCLIAGSLGYNPAQVDLGQGTVNLGAGLQNLPGYVAMSRDDAWTYVKQHKHVSFGLFGSLIVPGDEGESAFAAERKEAERIAAENNGAPDIHNVYAEFQKLTGFSAEECERLKAQEFERLLRGCRPRTAVIELLNRRTAGKANVVIAEDTVWTPAYIMKLLRRCGVDDGYTLYLSSGLGYRKSDGSLYDFLKGHFRGQAFLHIGDDELTDVQVPNGRRIHTLHVMHPDNMVKIAGFYSERMVDDPFCLLELLQEAAAHQRQQTGVR